VSLDAAYFAPGGFNCDADLARLPLACRIRLAPETARHIPAGASSCPADCFTPDEEPALHSTVS
jgi:hypothetical protein